MSSQPAPVEQLPVEGDPRFTIALIHDVIGVLTRHGYDLPDHRDFVDLLVPLYRYLHGRPRPLGAGPVPSRASQSTTRIPGSLTAP